MRIKKGEVVRVRDFDDEDWNYGIYMRRDRTQDAFKVLVLLNGRVAPHLYNKAERA